MKKIILLAFILSTIIFRPILFHTDTPSVVKGNEILKGIDISHYQGNILWHKIRHTDVDFVFIKATEGINYKDPTYSRNQINAEKYDFLSAPYHFFYPQHSGHKQAEHFLSVIQDKDTLPYIVDVEITGNQPPQTIRKELFAWIKTVKNQTGCIPIIYTNLFFWKKYLSEDFSHNRIWIADYSHSIDKWAKFQQISDTGRIDGINSYIDINAFYGDKKQLKKLVCREG